MLALATLPVHAQVYKWTDANGKVQYSDRPQDGASARELAPARPQAAPSPGSDNWRDRERISRENRVHQAEAERRLASAEDAARSKQEPFNPSANRSNRPLSDEEMCTRDRQQIEFAEKTPNLAIGHGNNAPQQLTEAQRQEVIRERKANHALACASARRR
ncbi:DUF4124 domain-containing protein [Pseudoduganella sp. UC29_106]|uniref:DUF4124 domain-containing protein n=1 Tax=Pseudoduganella sp. UC29_106 TaxID=3374553 RepID=UPI003757B131